MRKIRIYIFSVKEVPTTGFVDKVGAAHACARAGSTPFDGLGFYPCANGHILSAEEKNALMSVESFCRENGCQFEVVDFAKLSFVSKLKLRRKGVTRFPTIGCGGKLLYGIPTEKDLRLLAST